MNNDSPTTFLFETKDGRVRHDFIRATREAVRFRNWYNEDSSYSFDHVEDPPDAPGNRIPVGSTPFVLDVLETTVGKTPDPRNVPDEFMDPEWSGRTIMRGTHEDVTDERFVKDENHFDGASYCTDDPPSGTYQISEIVKMNAEYRVFVLNGERIGIRPYRGEFWTYPPDMNRVDAMIDRFENAPPAWTLDVYVNDRGTFVLEIHDFFSCGLYGWSDPMILPVMTVRWYRWFVRKNSPREVNDSKN